LQSPADLALLPAFSRNRIFMLFDPRVWRHGPPSSITIMTRNSLGLVVRHEAVTVHRASGTNTLIHRLAARAAIGDLERGESWVQLNPRGPEHGSEQETALTRQEGVRLGREWNLVSKWTSFYLEESHHSGTSDPFLNTPPQAPKKSQKSSSSRNKEHRSSVSSSESHGLTPQSPSSDGSPSLNGTKWPKSSSFQRRDSGFEVSRNKAESDDLSSSLGETLKAHDNQRVSSPTSDMSMENKDNDSIRSWILKDFNVSAPTFNPPASSAIYEVPEDSTKQQKTNDLEKEKVLKLINHQNFDGSFNFENPLVAAETTMSKVNTRPRPVGLLNGIFRSQFRSQSPQKRLHNRQSLLGHILGGSSSKSTQISVETHINDFLGNDFTMLTKALHDLAQLDPSLPDTMATIVLFERDLRDYYTLFSQSLRKAYTFVDGSIPDPEERSVWIDYARAILSRTPEATKPPLPKRKGHICVCAVCGKIAEGQSYEAHERAAGGDTNMRNLSQLSRNSFVQDHNTEASTEIITTQHSKEKPRRLVLFESIPEFRDNTSGG
jgi:hypothetical protein